jgi:hypothetical protein
MRIGMRAWVSGLTIALLILGLTSPSLAYMQDDGDLPNRVPIVIDLLVLRPAGLLMTAVGVGFYLFPVAPMTALVRPTDIAKPLGPLVVRPGRFTFVDPLGYHP